MEVLLKQKADLDKAISTYHSNVENTKAWLGILLLLILVIIFGSIAGSGSGKCSCDDKGQCSGDCDEWAKWLAGVCTCLIGVAIGAWLCDKNRKTSNCSNPFNGESDRLSKQLSDINDKIEAQQSSN